MWRCQTREKSERRRHLNDVLPTPDRALFQYSDKSLDFKCAAFLLRSSVSATDLPLVSYRWRQTHGEREARAVNLCHVHVQQMYFKKEGKKSPVSSPCLLFIFTAKQTWFPNRAPVLKCSQQLNKHPDHTVKDRMKYVVVKWGNTIGCLVSYSFPKNNLPLASFTGTRPVSIHAEWTWQEGMAMVTSDTIPLLPVRVRHTKQPPWLDVLCTERSIFLN